MEARVSYAMTERIDLPHGQAVAAVTEALRHEGFGVLTTIDVRKTMRERLAEDYPDYVILGACNPAFAHVVMKAQEDAGLLLPCNVVVRTDPADEKTVVSVQDPLVMADVAQSPQIAKVAELAREKLQRVLAEVKGGTR